jgi:peptidyl-prolyl cis-trans isomerase B (cyclophilin B)
MPKQYSAPPKMTIDTNKKYTATFDTSRGTIVCELFPKEAPKTVNNFVFLARDKFYDGTKFHRVIENFMVQGGDPEGTGRGGPGYRFEDEVGAGKPKHKIGSLSMANAGPGTNGSQFFIVFAGEGGLQPNYTPFGAVVRGLDIVRKVAEAGNDNSNLAGGGKPLKKVTIERVKISSY